MAIPTTTFIWTQSMDPYDILDYTINCAGLLEGGELIGSFTLQPLSEAIALGLNIKNSGGYTTKLIDGTSINFWAEIIEEEQGNPKFAGGVVLPMELTVITNSTPPRKKQRTLAIRVLEK